MPARSVQDYIETALEPLGEGFSVLGSDWGAYVSPGSPYTVREFYNQQSEPGRFVPPPEIFPSVVILTPEQRGEDSATPGPEALPPVVVDPELDTQTTVFEGQDAPYVATRTRETDWDWVYDQWVILNAPVPAEVDVPFHDTIDWGEVAGGILGGVLDPFGVGAAARAAISGPPAVVGGVGPGITSSLPVTAGAVMPANGCPPYGPKYAKICLATNVITPLRRRRRRRLLTSSDIKDLAALKAIVGGAALQGAVVQAIRR